MPPKNGVSHQLPAVMSSTLAHHPRKHLRTDEELGTERTEHDLPFAREDAEKVSLCYNCRLDTDGDSPPLSSSKDRTNRY